LHGLQRRGPIETHALDSSRTQLIAGTGRAGFHFHGIRKNGFSAGHGESALELLLMQASEWIVRWTALLRPHSRVLDIACGNGRHVRWFMDQGHAVTGIDRDISQCTAQGPSMTLLQVDIENSEWPLQTPENEPKVFDAVVVTNYLWRPLLPTIVQSLAPGGVLLYETFAAGNATFGRPARPEFLLQPQELLESCRGLHIVAYENGLLGNPSRVVQRIAAVRPEERTPTGEAAALYPL
jgi:SAM-dependent methyltransferase